MKPGEPIKVEDEIAVRSKQCAVVAKIDPAAFLSISDIFGSLSAHPVVIREFVGALSALWNDGTAATLRAYANS